MNGGWQGHELLLPITPDQPCGESLEDTALLASFDAIRLFGETRSPEAPPEQDEKGKEKLKARQPPDWAALKTNAAEALARSKDLRLLAYLGAALLRTDGVPSFFSTLKIASSWLESYWDTVYPVIDGDALARRNALNNLADPMAVVEWVRRAPLVDSRQHGKYSLRDIELVAAQPRTGDTEAPPQVQQIEAAFAATPVEELAARQEDIAAAMAALNRIDALMRNEAPEFVPSFDPLSTQLVKINRLLRDKLASRAGSTPAVAAGADAAGFPVVAAPIAVGAIRSREDATRALDAVAEFFRHNEPSSPIPLLLERAKRLVSKDFLEVLADIAPEALAVARAASGLK